MRRLSLLVALAVAAAVSGCGGDEGQKRVGEAFVKTGKETYRASMAMTMTGLAADPVTVEGDGIFDNENGRGRIRFDMTDFGRALGAPGDLGEMDIVYDPRALYLRFPILQQLQAGTKPWVKLQVDELTGGELGQLPQPGQVDPSTMIEFLEAADAQVEKVGEERVRGVQATRYRTAIDLDKALKELGESQRARARAAFEAFVTGGGEPRVPIELWIGEDGFVRRMETKVENTDLGDGRRGDMALSVELHDFGTSVDVKPPPPNQVSDFEELQQGAKR